MSLLNDIYELPILNKLFNYIGSYYTKLQSKSSEYVLRTYAVEVRLIDSITRNEMMVGANTASLMRLLVHAAFFIWYQSIYAVFYAFMLFPLPLLIVPIFQISAIEACAFTLAIIYRSAIELTMNVAIKLYEFILQGINQSREHVMEGVDDDEDQLLLSQQTFAKKILMGVARVINKILGIPLAIIHAIDSRVANFLYTKRQAWGEDRVKKLHAAYTFISGLIIGAPLVLALTILPIFVVKYAMLAAGIPMAIDFTMTAIAQLSLNQIAILATAMHVSINIALGLFVTSFTMLVDHAAQKNQKFNDSVNPATPHVAAMALRAQVIHFLQQKNYTAVLQYYKDHNVHPGHGHSGLIRSWPEMFRIAHNDSKDFFNGIPTSTLNLISANNPEIKTCGISFEIAEHPVYVTINGVRQYYDMMQLLRWLSMHNTDPRTREALLIGQITYDHEAKALLNIKVAEARADALAAGVNNGNNSGLYGMFHYLSFWGNNNNQATAQLPIVVPQVAPAVQAPGLGV